jgi:hypothetical protein
MTFSGSMKTLFIRPVETGPPAPCRPPDAMDGVESQEGGGLEPSAFVARTGGISDGPRLGRGTCADSALAPHGGTRR